MYKTELKLDEEKIIWPNGLRKKPDGIRKRRNVTVRSYSIVFLVVFIHVFYLGCYYC